jgi:hypothetical protein
MTDTEVLAMPNGRYQAFIRYQNRWIKEAEKASRK